MVKFVSDMSKKMLPTASTLIRARVELIAGTVTCSLPSLGVEARSVMGKVRPWSVESVIFTLAQLTGATFVLLTLHVTVGVVPPNHVTEVLGAVTRDGPEVLLTVSTTESSLTPPPLARLSRIITLKLSDRP